MGMGEYGEMITSTGVMTDGQNQVRGSLSGVGMCKKVIVIV